MSRALSLIWQTMNKYKFASASIQNFDIKRLSTRIVIIAGGAALNLFVLTLPLLITGKITSLFKDIPLLWFLLSASVFFICEIACFVQSDGCPDCQEQNPKRTRAFKLALWVGIGILAVYWIAILTRIHARHPSELMGVFQAIGIVVMAAGIGIRVVSIQTLGQYFITDIKIKPGQPLVRHSIYKRLRHPSELGLLCCVFGGSLILESKIGIVVCMVWILPLIIFRIANEERLLRRVFGEKFIGYVLSSKKLLPFIY